MTRAIAWLKAARPQLHILGVLPVLIGALLASRETGSLSLIRLALAESIMLFVLIATAFANDYADVETDRLNRNPSIFSGGSRAIVDGIISKVQMGRAVLAVSSVSILLSLAAIIFLKMDPITLVLTTIGLFIGIGYSLPPLRINWRGSGELFVIVMYSIFCVFFGYASQRGAGSSVDLLNLSIPIAITAFLAILITEIPDYDSDKLSGKRTIPALFGREAAILAYLFGILVLYLTAGVLYLSGALTKTACIGVASSILIGGPAAVLSLSRDRLGQKNLMTLCGMTMTLCVWVDAALIFSLIRR